MNGSRQTIIVGGLGVKSLPIEIMTLSMIAEPPRQNHVLSLPSRLRNENNVITFPRKNRKLFSKIKGVFREGFPK